MGRPPPSSAAGRAAPDESRPWWAWLVGGLGAGVVAATVVAVVLVGVLAGLIVLVAGAVLTTGVALVLGVLRG